MIEKEIKYDGWDGKPKKKTYFFHLSKSKIVEMKLSLDAELDTQGVDDYFKQIINAKSAVEALELFKALVKQAIGVMSEDGERFIQNDGIWDEFTQTPAYDSFFMELLMDADYAGRFFIGFLPSDFAEEVLNKQSQLKLPGLEGVRPDPPAKKTVNDYSYNELLALSKEEFDKLFAETKHPVPKHMLQAAMLRHDQDNPARV